MQRFLIAAALAALCTARAGAADDARQPVELPGPMREHLLANMRDHLAALTEIQRALGAGQTQRAADIAESRLGLSSLAAHGASHMAPFMPPAMQDIGSAMHRAASRFAVAAQASGADGNTARAVAALSEVGEQCVACHAAFRVR